MGDRSNLGIDFTGFPEGFTVLEAVMSFKVLDAEGEVRLIERVTPGLTPWEALGMVTTMADSLREDLLAAHRDPDD